MNKIEEKVVLITGGAGGIGLAMVKELLKNGARGVSIVDFSAENGQKAIKALESYGTNRTIFFQADVTNKQQFEQAFEKTIQTFKNIDIVINNAGIGDEVDWEKNLNVNLAAVIRGSYLAMRKYLPEHRSGEEGIIVNTGSVLGFKAMQSIPVYCAAKHGVVSLGQSLGGDAYYEKYKVRVLTLCPGKAETPFLLCVPQGKIPLRAQAKKDLDEVNREFVEPQAVGEALVNVINNGNNGSLWVIEDSTPLYEVVVPPWQSMKNI